MALPPGMLAQEFAESDNHCTITILLGRAITPLGMEMDNLAMRVHRLDPNQARICATDALAYVYTTMERSLLDSSVRAWKQQWPSGLGQLLAYIRMKVHFRILSGGSEKYRPMAV